MRRPKNQWRRSPAYGLIATCFSIVLAIPNAMATTLGPVRNTVLIGKPFVVNIEVAGAEASLSCITVDLLYGDTRANGTRFTLQNHSLRIRNEKPVDEPILTLSVSADCANPITRSYTIFPEAPSITSNLTAHTAGNTRDDDTDTPTRASSNENFFGVESAPNSDYIQVQKLAQTQEKHKPSKAFKNRTKESRSIVSAPKTNYVIASATAPETSPPLSISAAAPTTSTAKLDPSSHKPRLELDDLSWVHGDLDLRSSTEMLSAPAIDPSVRQHAREQWTSINAPYADISREQQTTTEHLAKLAKQLHSKDQEVRHLKELLTQQKTLQSRIWTWLLYSVLGLFSLGLVALRISRRQKPSQEQHNGQSTPQAFPWWLPRSNDAQSHTNTGLNSDDSELKYLSKVAQKGRDSMLGYLEELPVPDVQFGDTGLGDFPEFAPSQPAPAHLAPQAAAQPIPPTPAITPTQNAVGLLQDIHQQADFSVALGQYDKAEELLRQFIKEHPATSPLAYLNLLAIYHRAKNQDAFHALRQHFNSTFNAQVPDFQHFKSDNKGLSDYPHIFDHIQRIWGSPKVTQHIESLLFRKTDATQNTEAFSPLAYRELLLLYGIATETSATTADLARMQHIAANALQWLQPSTVFLGDEPAKDTQHEDPSDITNIDLPLELDFVISDLPSLETEVESQRSLLEITKETQPFTLDFNLDTPLELDRALPNDNDFTPKSDFEDTSLNLGIADADFSQTIDTSNSLDFHLDDSTQGATDTHIDLRLDDMNRPA